MKKELDEKLCADHPLIFAERNKPMSETAMCWGFDCGDGWYTIIDTLCQLLTSQYHAALREYKLLEGKVGLPKYSMPGADLVTQEEISKAKTKLDLKASQVPVAVQVKEKFGGLCFYVRGASEEQWNYIHFAETLSRRTCVKCGAPGRTNRDGWHTTLCDAHALEAGKSLDIEEDLEG